MAKDEDNDINGQVSADLEFTRRAEELLSKLRRRNKGPAGASEDELKEKEREKERNSTKHK
jgi:hypothetical protein